MKDESDKHRYRRILGIICKADGIIDHISKENGVTLYHIKFKNNLTSSYSMHHTMLSERDKLQTNTKVSLIRYGMGITLIWKRSFKLNPFKI